MPAGRPGDCSNSLLDVKFKDVADIRGLTTTTAAVKMKFHNGATCSGSFVSDQGHILTASHCAEVCLADPHRTGERQNMKCEIEVNGKKVPVRIVTMSPCLAEDRMKAFDAGRDDCQNEGDIAILLPDEPPTEFSCLAMAAAPPAEGEAVYALGYPGKTTRADGNSNGTRMYMSYGNVRKSDTCKKDTTGADVAIKSPAIYQKRMIQTTVDIAPGSSGGPLINSNGEVVGVASLVLNKQVAVSECAGSTFFESLTHLNAMTTRWRVNDEFRAMKCDRRKVKVTST